jgi:murein DD-endopeptidase MepM/ murein hydrolase activator NlpD
MKFLYPVSPTATITQTFAEHEERRVKYNLTLYNGGIDWGIPSGTSVRAAQAGTVTVARSDTDGYGTHVRIEHVDGATKYLTIYGHLQSFSVNIGEQVVAGREIGLSDNTGNSTGPHLHFELRKNGTAIDPMPLLVKTVAELNGSGPINNPIGNTPDLGKEPTQYPVMPKAMVVSSTLRVRNAPNTTTSTQVGSLTANTQVEVIRKVVQGNDIWLQIGNQQFIAMYYQGTVYSKWI